MTRVTTAKSEPTRKPARYGYRITVTMQAPNDEMMNWALLQGLRFAHEHWIGVSVSHKDDPLTKVSCRTTRLKKPKESK